jgi:hypothetical protein
MYFILIAKAPLVVVTVPLVDRNIPSYSCCVVATDQVLPSPLVFTDAEVADTTAQVPPALGIVGLPPNVVEPQPKVIDAIVATAPRLSATTPTPGVPTDEVKQYIPEGLIVPVTVEVGDCITATATRYCLAAPGLTLSKTTSKLKASPARTGEPSG